MCRRRHSLVSSLSTSALPRGEIVRGKDSGRPEGLQAGLEPEPEPGLAARPPPPLPPRPAASRLREAMDDDDEDEIFRQKAMALCVATCVSVPRLPGWASHCWSAAGHVHGGPDWDGLAALPGTKRAAVSPRSPRRPSRSPAGSVARTPTSPKKRARMTCGRCSTRSTRTGKPRLPLLLLSPSYLSSPRATRASSRP